MPEAFVLQTLRTARMNPNGGTIAVGHAFGATGVAGLGVAVLVERVVA